MSRQRRRCQVLLVNECAVKQASLESTMEGSDGCCKSNSGWEAVQNGRSHDPESSSSKQGFDLKDDQKFLARRSERSRWYANEDQFIEVHRLLVESNLERVIAIL